MWRQGKKVQLKAAKSSPYSSGGAGGAREGRSSQKLSRNEQFAMEATVSDQNNRIAQLEEQLKSAMNAMQEMASGSGTQQWRSSWDSWSTWWSQTEELANKRVKEDSQW